jgi:hypothetical protein
VIEERIKYQKLMYPYKNSSEEIAFVKTNLNRNNTKLLSMAFCIRNNLEKNSNDKH